MGIKQSPRRKLQCKGDDVVISVLYYYLQSLCKPKLFLFQEDVMLPEGHTSTVACFIPATVLLLCDREKISQVVNIESRKR